MFAPSASRERSTGRGATGGGGGGPTAASTAADLEEQIERCLEKSQYRSAIPLLECLSRLSNEAPEHLYRLAVSLAEVGEYDSALANAQRVVERIKQLHAHHHHQQQPQGYFQAPSGAAATTSALSLPHTAPQLFAASPGSTHTQQQQPLGGGGGVGGGSSVLVGGSSMKPEFKELERKAVTLAMRCSIARNDDTNTFSFAEQILANDPEDVDALCAMGQCAQNAGNLQLAVQRFKDALMADPVCSRAFDALCNQYLVSRAELAHFVRSSLTFPRGSEALREVYLTRTGATDAPAEGDSSNNGLVLPANNHGSNSAVTVAAIPRHYALFRSLQQDYKLRDLNGALQKAAQLFEHSPFDLEATCLYLTILSERVDSTTLYEAGHRLARERPHHSLSYYAIGAYYYTLHSYEKAGRFFCRATEVAPVLPAASIALGHCYAKLEEGETALGIYRNASQSFPGLHLCNLHLGIQYTKVQQWALAMCCCEAARKINPTDPLVLNEIGVIYFRTGRYQQALHFFTDAQERLPNKLNPGRYLDCILFNVATMYRKLKDYDSALRSYTDYVRNNPNDFRGHCALGYTHHLMGDSKTAIEHYHTSLSMKNDIFCRDLLELALGEEYSKDVGTWASATAVATASQAPLARSDSGNMVGQGSGGFSPSPSFGAVPNVLGLSTIGRNPQLVGGTTRSESCPQGQPGQPQAAGRGGSGAGGYQDPTPSPQPTGRTLF